MDDATDSAYSRAPEAQDVLDLCRSLNAEGARYVLIGGFAVVLHGFVRTTKDIDLLVDPSPENLRRIKRAMSSLPDNAAALVADDDIENYGVVRVADEIVVDLMGSACGITYDDARSEVEVFALDDVAIPVASKRLLIKMKDTVRPGDQLDRAFLETRIEAENET